MQQVKEIHVHILFCFISVCVEKRLLNFAFTPFGSSRLMIPIVSGSAFAAVFLRATQWHNIHLSQFGSFILSSNVIYIFFCAFVNLIPHRNSNSNPHCLSRYSTLTTVEKRRNGNAFGGWRVAAITHRCMCCVCNVCSRNWCNIKLYVLPACGMSDRSKC